MIVVDVIAGLAAVGLSFGATICVVLLRESAALRRARERWARKAIAAEPEWRPDYRRVRAIQLQLELDAKGRRSRKPLA